MNHIALKTSNPTPLSDADIARILGHSRISQASARRIVDEYRRRLRVQGAVVEEYKKMVVKMRARKREPEYWGTSDGD